MNIDPKQVHTFQVKFDAGNAVPPPFHYAYSLEVKLAELNNPFTYNIQYLHREELTEEEILEEGYTLNDDWQWQGNLPQNWQTAIFEQIQKQSWPRKPEKAHEEEAHLDITLLGHDGQTLFEGRPADPAVWEFFIQELIQAIYELAEKEAPFQLHYIEISSTHPSLQIHLEASFAQRTIKAKKQEEGEPEEQIQPDWKELKNIMKITFLPDYDYEKAREQEPKKRGKYLNTGEGLWFKFEESLLEPGKKSKTLDQVERMLKGLFE